MPTRTSPDAKLRTAREDDTKGYVLTYYEELRRFVSDAAQAGEALIIYLC